jgi:imidazolonepropionase-like amidohydrolase
MANGIPLAVVLTAVSWAAAAACPLAAQTSALRFGTLVDGKGGVLSDAVIVVEKDRIVSVGSGTSAIPAGAEVVDLRRYTAIPGLIDVHTHMTYFWDEAPGTRPLGQAPRLPAVTVFLAQENARKTLETGVTTVRDLGSSEYNDLAMRDLINRGAMVGPRMFVAGYGLSKLRASARAGAPPPVAAPLRGRVSGDTLEIQQAVRAQVDAGVDWIKMYGSTGSYQDVTGRETFTFAEMKAAVDAAHRAGKRIAIHSYGPDGGRDAMRAGAESVEHPADLDDSTLVEWAARGTVYVPTIDHNRFYAENRETFGWTAEQAAALDEFRARNFETARRAFRAGVTFAMGSDAVYTMFGQNTRELGFFVQLGMTPAQALATATKNAAALLGMPESLGAIAPGYYADIVAVEGNPLADINVVVHGVRWVMKGGAVVVDRR